MDFEVINYLAITFVIGVIVLGLLRRLLRRVEDERRERVEGRQDFQAISTRSPQKGPLMKAREIALASVESRFSIVRRFLTLAVVLIWLLALSFPFLGMVPTAAISLLIGSTAIIVGIAARPFIENMIAGIVITFSRPFATGDTVTIDGNYGTVEDITMTHTIVKLWNWRRYVIPNAQMLTKEFTNLTLHDPYQWVHVEFWVSSDAELDVVQEKAIEAAASSKYFSNYEPPRFWVIEMGKEAIRCWVAAWADSPTDAWQLTNDIRTELAKQLRILKITPHRFVLEVSNSSMQRAQGYKKKQA